MNTMLVWILTLVGSWSHTYGNTTVVGHFKTKEMCQHVLTNMPGQETRSARCIQAEIIK